MKRKRISISEPLSFAFDIDNEKSIIPSFNPGGTSGVAIELGWSYIVNQKMPIDNFEELRSNPTQERWSDRSTNTTSR